MLLSMYVSNTNLILIFLKIQKIVFQKTKLNMGLLDFLGLGEKKFDGSCVMGDEEIMSPKAHGSSDRPVQGILRWECDRKVADNICNFNR